MSKDVYHESYQAIKGVVDSTRFRWIGDYEKGQPQFEIDATYSPKSRDLKKRRARRKMTRKMRYKARKRNEKSTRKRTLKKKRMTRTRRKM